MKFTREQLAMLAGAYAITHKGKHMGGTYIVRDRDTDEIQEMPFPEAVEIIYNMVERETKAVTK